MDAGIVSAISALAGTSIGALTSLASTWMTTKAQANAARIAAERAKREELYGRYMDELAVLYANALNNTSVDYDRLTIAYGLSGRIGLSATQPVAEGAIEALRIIVDIALGPCRTQQEMREMMDQPGMNVISAYAKLCREELEGLR
ncbi:MAG: hypothetical protein FJ144_27330 [Deltaproteobacteria bacterium]|nr:hypothetical protein [Deltaproteobacteria bacterium]